jgi:hypothetical protein
MVEVRLKYRRVAAGAALIALGLIAIPTLGCQQSTRSPEGLTPQQVRTRLLEELRTVGLKNCTLGRFGSLNDGGYLLCENLIADVASTYSYGVGPEDEFACELSARSSLPVHRYDCSDSPPPTCDPGKLIVHNACAGPRRETVKSRVFDTLSNQIAANGDTGKRLIMTMDVEGAEWETLMATPDAVLERIDQLPIEFHGVNEARFLEVILKLKRQFHLVNLNFNNYSCTADAAPLPGWAFQALFVNKRVGVMDAEATVPAPRSMLNAPDDPGAQDCQILTEQDAANLRAVREALFTELQPVTLRNCTLARFGSAHDGGYLMCQNLISELGAAYSYGIGPNDDWGCAVSKQYKVTTHQYDCFDPARPVCEGGRFVFHNECVGDRRQERMSRTFDTLANQVLANGDAGKHLLVKMDVEGAEWNSLIVTPDSVLERIDQIALELHGVHDARFLATVRRLKQHFYVVNLNANNQACAPDVAPFRSRANQVLMVNKRIGVLETRAPVPARLSPLNALDNPAVSACAPPPEP